MVVGAAQLLRNSWKFTKGECGPLEIGVKGTQPGQNIDIFQIQSMCPGGAKHQLSLEKEEDLGPAPIAKGV